MDQAQLPAGPPCPKEQRETVNLQGKGEQKETSGLNQAEARLPPKWIYTSFPAVLAPSHTYSRHLINAFSIKEITTCNQLLRGTALWVGSSRRRILTLVSAGSVFTRPSPSPPYKSVLILSPGTLLAGSTSALLHCWDTWFRGAVPMPQSLKMTTKAVVATDRSICLCGRVQ